MTTLSVYAPTYDPYDGYGRMALELVHWLSQEGVHVNAMNVAQGQVVHETQSEAIQALLKKPIQATVGGLVLGYPTLYEKYGALANSGPMVAVTMFESTTLPEGWVEALNQCKAVIVPSTWLEKAMRNNGVIKPVHVVPLGISEVFVPPGIHGQRGVRDDVSEDKPFTFLTWGDRGARKGWDVACKAFYAAFGDRKDVKLIIKARDGSMPYEITNPNVEVMRADLDEWGLRELYLSVDCMVFPSRGEGFGLPPREFAATAGPVIATEWWADDIPQWGYRVEYEMVTAWQGHPTMEGLGKWAEPDIEHLTKQMLHVFDMNPKLRTYMGGRSATRVRKLYSWPNFAKQVLRIWREASSHKSLSAKRKARRERKREVQHVGNE